MAMRRELRWIYKALLKPEGEVVNIRELISLYDRYNEFRKEIQESKVAPGTLKNSLPPLKMPNYLEWLSQYIIREGKDELRSD
jgi:hypothetical protein